MCELTRHRALVVVFSCLLLRGFPACSQMNTLGGKETFSAGRFTPKDVSSIVAAIESSAYDIPDSWERELRVRRVDLGAQPGLILQGTNLLCGATGNCQLWVLRKLNGKWVSLFAMEQAPIVEGFQLGPGITHSIKDLIIVTNTSAEHNHRVIYRFDGNAYQSHSD